MTCYSFQQIDSSFSGAGTIREAISVLQLEADSVVKKVRRDFLATQRGFDSLIDADPRGGKTHLKIKNPVGSEIKNQRNYWINPETDSTQITKSESSNKVVVGVVFFNAPVTEKPAIETAVKSGLKKQHTPIFINNVTNR